jgi:hypothetical protein
MSIQSLSEAIAHYGREGYLLTVAQDGPHTSNVTVELRDGCIHCVLGTSAARNIAREPHVSLFWPPTESGGYALIVNGIAEGRPYSSGAIAAAITVTKSVLHRPGPRGADSDGACGSDCRRLTR